jgi:hypothetical protein
MVYDHLHQHYVSSTTNPAAHPMFAGPIGMQGPVGSIGSPGPGGISDAQRDWEAQTPIHDEGEDDFPF